MDNNNNSINEEMTKAGLDPCNDEDVKKVQKAIREDFDNAEKRAFEALRQARHAERQSQLQAAKTAELAKVTEQADRFRTILKYRSMGLGLPADDLDTDDPDVIAAAQPYIAREQQGMIQRGVSKVASTRHQNNQADLIAQYQAEISQYRGGVSLAMKHMQIKDKYRKLGMDFDQYEKPRR